MLARTEDVQLFPPTAQIEGAYEGRSGVRRFLAYVQDAGPNFRLSVERLESIGPDRVLGFLQATMSGRASGIDNDFPVTNIYDLANGRIRRVRVFMDRDAALEAAGLSE